MGKKDKKVVAEEEEEVVVEKKDKKSKKAKEEEEVAVEETTTKSKKDKKRKTEEEEEEEAPKKDKKKDKKSKTDDVEEEEAPKKKAKKTKEDDEEEEEAPKKGKKDKKRKAEDDEEEEDEEANKKMKKNDGSAAPVSKTEPSDRLFLGNCPNSMQDEKVYEMFGKKGITNIEWNQKGKKPTKTAFVTFSSVDAAKAALQTVGLQTADGISCDFARPQKTSGAGAPSPTSNGGSGRENDDRTIFMGNLAEKNEKAVKAAFKSLGEDCIEFIRWGERDGEFRRFAFVVCKDVETMQAMMAMDPPTIKGQQARMKPALEPKGNNPREGRASGDGKSFGGDNACFKCGESGHRKSECTFERPCFNCGKTGHIKADCPNENNRDARTLFISGCPDNIDDSDITAVFGKFAVNKIRWVEKDGVFKGCGFVEMCDEERAKTALTRSINVHGRDLRIVASNPREPRDNSGGPKGGPPQKGGAKGGFQKTPPAKAKKTFDEDEGDDE